MALWLAFSLMLATHWSLNPIHTLVVPYCSQDLYLGSGASFNLTADVSLVSNGGMYLVKL